LGRGVQFRASWLVGEMLSSQRELASLDAQLELYRKKKDKLTFRSPINGQIPTWNVVQRLTCGPPSPRQAWR
jgi:hypothetical protein